MAGLHDIVVIDDKSNNHQALSFKAGHFWLA